MKKIRLNTVVLGNYQNIFSCFNLSLFEALKPPGVNLQVIRFDGCNKGDEIHLKVGLLGIKTNWISRIISNHQDEKECLFIDEGILLPPPLSKWHHRHIVQKITDKKSRIIDDISYSCRGGSSIETLIWPILWTQFAMRAPVYRRVFSNEK